MIRSHTPLLALLLLASASTVASAAGKKTPPAALNTAIGNVQPRAAAQAAVAAQRSGGAQPAAAATPLTLEPAPMPNEELFAPVQRANEDPEIKPTVFRPSAQFRGDGVLPGSSAQSYEERHMMPAVGANLNLPLK